jgi:rhamnogalacturonan endolyase
MCDFAPATLPTQAVQSSMRIEIVRDLFVTCAFLPLVAARFSADETSAYLQFEYYRLFVSVNKTLGNIDTLVLDE